MQFPEILKLGEIPLAKDFIDSHANCIRKVQASRRAPHRQADTFFRMLQKQLFGQALRFFTKDKEAVFGIFHIAIGMLSLGCKKIEITALVLLEEVFHIVIISQIKQVPIIKPRSFELFIVYLKTHGADNMKPCPRSGAGAGNIACILRDLGLHQNHI